MFYSIFSSLCERQGISKSKALEEIGLSSGNLPKWRKGSVPKVEILTKIAEYFDVSVDYLLGNSDERKPINKDITADDIKFALFGGDSEYISDESYEDVLAFAKIIAEKEKRKRAEMNELN